MFTADNTNELILLVERKALATAMKPVRMWYITITRVCLSSDQTDIPPITDNNIKNMLEWITLHGHLTIFYI